MNLFNLFTKKKTPPSTGSTTTHIVAFSGPQYGPKPMPETIKFPVVYVLVTRRELDRNSHYFHVYDYKTRAEAEEKGEQERYPYVVIEIPSIEWKRTDWVSG